ncbi:MAG: PIG-L family deacetylase [Bryobacterales bacterium]|nr:PIG-L family deacetylase [Bryobacteraceae bacterium]MDW8130250.1 PIG-L family deacetylase [Bryobacterales bacterium]
MKLSRADAEIWVPDGATAETALARTTHMGISAHPDDTEIMAMDGILAGFGNQERWFTAVIVTNGAGSPRDGIYASFTDEQMQIVRRREQKKAAVVGEYSAAVFLNHSSADVKDARNAGPLEDLKTILAVARPEIVYTHNLADKHDTHVAVALRAIAAIRSLPREARPRRLYGCEVWRDLDWLVDQDKVVFRLDAHDNISMALVSLFDSQVAGGKRYDLATMGRRRAHATYLESHAVDVAQSVSFAMDLTPLIEDDALDPHDYVQGFIRRFAEDVSARVKKLI